MVPVNPDDGVRRRVVVATADALFLAAASDVAGILGLSAVPAGSGSLPGDIVIVDAATWAGTPPEGDFASMIVCIPGRAPAAFSRWSAMAAWTVRRERLAEELFDVLRAALPALPSGGGPG
ncbi:hypothetical protein HRbin29_01144 [bacterium HR29]|jgi:hypothetical protein|nr:hypothetical protein HRbin29_01144 [bacterium HR29]